MTTSRNPVLRGLGAVVVVGTVVGVVAAVGSVMGGNDLWDRRPEYTPLHTADELRELPDLAEVLPGHVEATRAALEAVASTASVTWEESDAQRFAAERDGVDEQVVDGHPVLRWAPEPWDTAQPAAVDEALTDDLRAALAGALGPLGYRVTGASPGAGMFAHELRILVVGDDDLSLELVDLGDGSLRLLSRTGAHVYRGGDDCEPLACRPTVEDLLAGP